MKTMVRLKRIWKMFVSLEGSMFRSGLAFSMLLALAPALTLIVLLFSYGSLDLSPIINAMHGFLPEELIDPLLAYLTNRDYGATVSTIIAVVTALWLASRGLHSFVMISARNENVNYSSLIIKIKSIVFFILLIGMVFGLLFLLSLTDWNVLTFGPGILLIFYYILYRFLSFEKKEWSYGMLGAGVAMLATSIFSWLFVGMLQQFLLASYSVSYGPFASIVVLLLSFYVLASIIYLGYCVSEEYKVKKKPADIVYKYDNFESLLSKFKVNNSKEN